MHPIDSNVLKPACKLFLPFYDFVSSIWENRFLLYKTYTTGQLRIKTVFQNNNIQDSFHAFLVIFFLEVFSSRVQSSIRGGGGGGGGG